MEQTLDEKLKDIVKDIQSGKYGEPDLKHLELSAEIQAYLESPHKDLTKI